MTDQQEPLPPFFVPDPPAGPARTGPAVAGERPAAPSPITSYAEAADLAARLTGLHAISCLTQFLLETGGAWPPPANNPSNIMWPATQPLPDYPWFAHAVGRLPNTAIIYDTLAHGVEAYASLLNQGDAYAAVRATRGKPWQQQLTAIGESPWDAGHYTSAGKPPGSSLIALATQLLASHTGTVDGAGYPPEGKGAAPGGKGLPPRLPPAAVRLAPWQFWNQLDDPAQDGDTSGPNGSGPNAYNDCGPESDAEILWHLTNVTLDADYIWDCIQQRRALSGQTTGPGYTSTQDHIDFFTSVAGTPCRELSVDPSLSFASAEVQSFISAIKRALAHGHPLLGLFSYSAPNAPDGHFRAILGYNRDHIITGDPLRSGAARVETLESFWAWSRGWALEIQRKRAIAE